MLKLYIGRNAGRTVCLTLPASYEEVDKALAEFGDARPEAPVLIQEARTSVPYLEGRLKGFSFEEKENRQELSFLARRIRYLTQTDQISDTDGTGRVLSCAPDGRAGNTGGDHQPLLQPGPV